MSRWATLALAATVVLSGCSRGSGATESTPTPTPSNGTADNRNPVGEIFNDPQAQACLKAAGITLPTRMARPSGFATGARPSGFPTDFPSGERPSGFPTSFPSGERPSGVPGAGSGAQFQEIQQALAACGITLSPPTGRPNG